MSALLQQQFAFSRLLPRLIDEAHRLGFEVQFGELWRTPEQARWNAAHGLGIVNSNHCNRIAVDLNLWKDGHLSGDIDDYRPLAEFWKSLSRTEAICVAGVDFKKPDIFHFSLFFNGIK